MRVHSALMLQLATNELPASLMVMLQRQYDCCLLGVHFCQSTARPLFNQEFISALQILVRIKENESAV